MVRSSTSPVDLGKLNTMKTTLLSSFVVLLTLFWCSLQTCSSFSAYKVPGSMSSSHGYDFFLM